MKLKDLDLFPSSSIDNKDLIWVSKYESGTEGSSGTYTSYRLDFNQLRSKIGTGTANNTTYLRGDGTWAAAGLTKFTEAEATTSPNNTVYVDSLTAIGASTNVDIALVPKGSGAFLLAIPDGTATGGNKRGTYAVDLQLARASAIRVASGNYSVNIGGSDNNATQTHSTNIGGTFNAVQGDYAGNLAGQGNTNNGKWGTTSGYSNTNSAQAGTCMGAATTTSGAVGNAGFGYLCTNSAPDLPGFVACYDNVNSGNGGVALGVESSNSIHNKKVFGGSKFTTRGDNQLTELILSISTTDATATTLTSNRAVAGTTNQLTLQNQQLITFQGIIQGKQASSTNACSWKFEGTIVRGANAGTTTLVGTPTITAIDNSIGWGTPTLTADTTNGCLKVQVIGASATNIKWNCRIDSIELIN